MSFWLPPSARWSLDPGLRREDENEFPPRFLFVSSAKAGAQGPWWGSPCPGELQRSKRSAGTMPGCCWKRQQLLCRGGAGGPMSFWLPSSARWPLDPGLRREDENEFPSRFSFVSPAKAGAQGPRCGSPLPRRTSAQQAFRRHNVPGVVERDSSFCAAEEIGRAHV